MRSVCNILFIFCPTQVMFQGLWERGKIWETNWNVFVTLGTVIYNFSFQSLNNDTHKTFFGTKVCDLRYLQVIAIALFSVLKFLNHYLLRKLKKDVFIWQFFSQQNKNLFRKLYIYPNKVNLTVVTNKLVQGFGTPGSIIDYSTKFLSRQIYNLFEIWFSYTDEEGKVYRLQWILHLDCPCLDHKCQQSFQNHPISLKTSPFQWYSGKCFFFLIFILDHLS